MRIWRISDFADLSGHGGMLAPGRWHSGGRRIVYLSDHPATSLQEIMVHRDVDVGELPSTYQLLAVDVADDVAFTEIDERHLPEAWRMDEGTTQSVGDHWLTEGSTALLRVPSAIVPFAWNWLLNPAHADAAEIVVASVTRALFDPRLSGA